MQRGEDGKVNYYYDITGMISLKAMFEKTTMLERDMRELVEAVIEESKEVQLYLLEPGRLLLEPEYIFYGNETYYFCYLPFHPGNFREDFHELTEYFVERTDYRQEEGTRYAYELHKLTMDENYSVQQVEEKMQELRREAEKVQESLQESEPVIPRADRIAEVWDLDEDAKERGTLKKLTVPQFLKRKRKARWGDWDPMMAMEGGNL